MTKTIISSLVTHTVLLGGAGALSPLVITASGDIIPYAGVDGSGSGTVGVMAVSTGVTLVNHGSVGATSIQSTTGVDFRSGGDLLVNTGSISGGQAMYVVPGQAATAGVMIDDGIVRNAASGVIAGGEGGLYRTGTGGPGSTGIMLAGSRLFNAGLIEGGSGDTAPVGGVGGLGVMLSGGSVTTTGTITGGQGGSGIGDAGQGGQGGTGLFIDGGVVRDLGQVSGGAGGSGMGGVGQAGDAVQFGSAAAVLDIGAGAVFGGIVAANAADVLGLVGAGGTLTGLGSAFTGFGRIDAMAGSSWTIDGASQLGSATLVAQGSLDLRGNVDGTGRLELRDGGTVDVTGHLGLAAVRFGSGSETLALGAHADVGSRLIGFGQSDTIDIAGVVTALQFGSGVLTLQGSGFTQTLTLAGQYEMAGFHTASDGAGGTAVTYAPPAEHRPSPALTETWASRSTL